AHGFSIISVSLDGQGTQDFPNPVKDLNLLKRRNALPEVVPALYLIDPKEPQAQALGFGIMNSKDLEERIAEAVGINLQQGTITASKLDVLD
ncbi:MAG: conjugal transfer protein TraF, partial [Pseudomonadales bacterium]|nr:conjugal transfer protein TraF [Pseudomonadales bacterium]